MSLIALSLIVVSLILVSLIVVSLIASRHRVRARQPQECRRRRQDRKKLTPTHGQRRLRIPSIPVRMAVVPVLITFAVFRPARSWLNSCLRPVADAPCSRSKSANERPIALSTSSKVPPGPSFGAHPLPQGDQCVADASLNRSQWEVQQGCYLGVGVSTKVDQGECVALDRCEAAESCADLLTVEFTVEALLHGVPGMIVLWFAGLHRPRLVPDDTSGDRRTRSTARRWAMVIIQASTLPRPGSYRADCCQISR